MTHYVLGFAFHETFDDLQTVLLIEKKRPDWQKGFLNGVGGKMESSDKNPKAAMVREFEEETGIASAERDWVYYAHMKGKDWHCYCFYSLEIDTTKSRTQTDEELEWVTVNQLISIKHRLLSNLPTLIMLALDVVGPNEVLFDYTTNEAA